MLAASTQFSAMIDGQDIIGDFKVTLSLPGGVYPDVTLAVESLTITAALVSDLPQGTRLETGYPKIDADITLSGIVDLTDETKTAAWLFGPWGPQADDGTVSPLYQTQVLYSAVTIDVGLDPTGSAGVPELLRKFTGYIDQISINTDGSVTLNCLDNHTKIRAVPTVPAAVIPPPMNSGLTSEFVLDTLIYRASNGRVGTRPPTRPSCILNVGLRTSLFPDVGYQLGQNMQPVYSPGAFGSALQWDNSGLGLFEFTTTAPAGSTFFMEYWITRPQSVAPWGPVVGINDAAASSSMGVQVSSGTFRVFAPGNSTATPDFTWNFGPIDFLAPHYVGVLWTQAPGSTAWSATLYLDGLSTTASGTSAAARGPNPWNRAFVQTSTGGSETIEALQVTNETAPVINYPFTPTAVLDPSLNTLQAVPAYSGDPWALIQQIADAELGVAGFDESGTFRFFNRITLRSGAVVRTLTSATSLLSLSATTAASELVNRVQVTTQPWTFTAGGLAYQASTVQKIAKKSTQTFVIDLGELLIGQISQTPPTTLPNGHSTTDGFSYFRASTTRYGTAEAVLAQGAVLLQQTDSSHIQVTVTNPYTFDIWLVSPSNYLDMPAGTPALWISGSSAAQAAGNVADVQFPPLNPDGTGGAASTQSGEVAYTISSNPWVQDDASALQLAQDIVADMYVARPSLNSTPIIADPRLQLADRVVVQDPDVTNMSEHALLFGWELTWDASNGLDMTVDARTIAPPGAWIGGVAGRSEGDLTTWGY